MVALGDLAGASLVLQPALRRLHDRLKHAARLPGGRVLLPAAPGGHSQTALLLTALLPPAVDAPPDRQVALPHPHALHCPHLLRIPVAPLRGRGAVQSRADVELYVFAPQLSLQGGALAGGGRLVEEDLEVLGGVRPQTAVPALVANVRRLLQVDRRLGTPVMDRGCRQLGLHCEEGWQVDSEVLLVF